MSTVPTVQATSLWEGPPLKPIPELPPIDASRIIDMKKYNEMFEEDDRLRLLELRNEKDRPLILIMVSIIKKIEGLWKTPSTSSTMMPTLYKQVAIELYGRTGELVSYPSIKDIWKNVRRVIRDRIIRAITVDKMSPGVMETFMWEYWPYQTARFYREKLMDLEEELRRKLNNSSRKRSQAPPTQTPPTEKKRESSVSSGTSTSSENSGEAITPEMNPPVEQMHQNENQNQNPTSSSEIRTPKRQMLAPVKPLHPSLTKPEFRISKSEPEAVQVDEDYYELKEENDEDYGTSGIPNSRKPENSRNQADYQIQLNVAGVLFTTMKSTLTKKSGWFRENLGTDYQKFIDRDFTHFRIILNYMRDGVISLPDSVQEIEEIHREAVYYEMAELIGICVLKLEKMKKK